MTSGPDRVGRWLITAARAGGLAGVVFGTLIASAFLLEPRDWTDRPWYETGIRSGLFFGAITGAVLATTQTLVEARNGRRWPIPLAGLITGAVTGLIIGALIAAPVGALIAYRGAWTPHSPNSPHSRTPPATS